MQSRLIKAILFGLIIGILGLLAGFSETISRLDEDSGLGLLFKLRGQRTPPSDVVVVSIDKASSDQLGLPNNPDKWPRSVHARLVPILAKAGAAVTAFDVHFIEARDPSDDAKFAEAIAKAGNVVLCEPMIAREIPVSGQGEARAAVHSIEKRVMPLSLFARACVATAPFALPRIPFKVNQYWAFKTGAGDSPTLPVVAFQLYTASAYGPFLNLLKQASPQWAPKLPATIEAAEKSGGVKTLISNIRGIFESDPQVEKRMMAALKQSSNLMADEKKSRLIQSLIQMYGGSNRRYINYYGPPRTITTLPYYRALQIGDDGQETPGIDLKDKAVFVGLSEVLLAERKDSFYTVYSQANGVFISGVEIAATAMANILENTPVRPIPLAFYVALILLWGTGLGIVCRMYPVLISASVVVGASLLYLASSVLQFKFFDLWYPIIIPVVLQAPLAFLGSAGIKYGILFKEFLVKQRMEEDLTSAKDLQESMLPAECPVIEGYQLAAKSTPAREVGGDFFDFFEPNEEMLGLVIGDVTGKSVSGALVMSASRSIFRMLSEQELSVANIMIQANKRTKKDIKSGMFVALLFAMLDIKNKILSICSAGQTQPIHYVAATGEAKLVETEGDSFPLGILDDPDYQETNIELKSGDKIMFYTDGIVEAMNAKEEMFGFERLLEIMQQAGDKDATTLLNETIDSVNAFAGNVAQHDDLTIIVLGVAE